MGVFDESKMSKNALSQTGASNILQLKTGLCMLTNGSVVFMYVWKQKQETKLFQIPKKLVLLDIDTEMHSATVKTGYNDQTFKRTDRHETHVSIGLFDRTELK